MLSAILNKGVPSVFIIAMVAFCLSSLFARQPARDSIDVDDIKTEDSIASENIEPIDTIPPSKPLKSHGSLFTLAEKNYDAINKQDIQYINYASFTDILKKKYHYYPLFLGGYGQFNSFSVFGGTPRNISVGFNGRSFEDPAFSTLNLFQLAPEFMEKAEIMTGTDAITFSNSGSGLYINIQEIIHNTKYPYTKIWLSEANFDFISADGIFSQNFAKNWNFTFGFRSVTSAGRYDNSWLDGWNVRATLRWNPTDRTSISFVEYFTNHGMGTTGGIEASDGNYCDDLVAFPLYEQVDERVFRHDMTLSLTSILDEDSTHAINSSIFFSHSEWDRRRSAEMLFNENDSSLYYSDLSYYVGANARYENNLLEFTKLSGGGELKYIFLEANDYIQSLKGVSASGFGRLKIIFSDDFSLTGGLRLKLRDEKYAASLGGKLDFNLTKEILLSADISYSERFPSPSEGLSLNNEKNLLGLFKFNWKKEESNLDFTVFGRQVISPLFAEPIYNQNGMLVNAKGYNGNDQFIAGALIDAGTSLAHSLLINNDKLIISGWANIQLSIGDGGSSKRFPSFYGGFETYYEILIGRSRARIGASVEMLSAFKGEYFFPVNRMYIPYDSEKGFSTNGTEIFAKARLGSNAYVKLSLENPLSQCYYYVPVYPMYEMNFKFSVAWSFMD